jgi:outer membrane immunogenic protein
MVSAAQCRVKDQKMGMRVVKTILPRTIACGAVLVAWCLNGACAAPPAAASGSNWTGWYAGVVGGWISQDGIINNTVGNNGDTDTRSVEFQQALAGSVDTHSSSGILGGELGYNAMLGPMWLIGAETDFSWTGINNNTTVANVIHFTGPTTTTPLLTTGSERLDWLGTARFRTGYLWTPNFLLYITAGLAYGGESSSVGVDQPPLGPHGHSVNLVSSTSGASVGSTVGAGVEWRFMGNWSVKGEYLYYWLPHESLFISRPSDPGFTLYSIANFQGSIVRGGLIYKF